MRPMVNGAGAGGGHLMDKQSLVPVVQELWNTWEIHFLIVLSLFLQVFLFLFGGMRRHCSKWYLRTVLWLAYLAADSVAVFALGHLAVRAREPGHELMALWAPFVLVHLGGQDTITAFSKQDNELWTRHLLNLVLQTAVAGYVVAKASWPDTRLRAVMVIIFISGFFKYAERTGCLAYSDTSNLLMNKMDFLWKQKRSNEGQIKQSLLKRIKVKQSLHKGAEVTLDMMKEGSSAEPPHILFLEAFSIINELIATDGPLNKAHAIAAHGDLQGPLQGFLSSKSRHSAYEYVGAILENCYRWLYTKEPSRLQNVLFPSNPLLTTIATSIALALFKATVDKAGDQLYTSSSSSRVDITVTYILLVGAIALDVFSIITFIFRYVCLPRLPNCRKRQQRRQWSQEIQQYNIISIAGKSPICQWLACDVDSIPVKKKHTSIKKFILDTLLASGTRKEWSIASSRGQLALQKWQERHHSTHFATTTTLKSLKETVASSTDFPISMLVLHIATDICYHFGGTNSSDHGEAVKKHKQTSTELSNYIMYLVFQCGVMLTINSKIAHDKARDEIADRVSSQRQKIYEVSKSRRDLLPSRFSTFKRKICNVFKRCEDLGNDKGKAAVISLFEAVKEQRQAFSMGEINIGHQESAEQQDSTNEIESQESTDTDDNHIKKLQMNSKTLESPVLPRAVAVAQELIAIENEAERWELIAKVWAEMLYYIAPRCGGDFHYEHLSRGGEFVTHVLLLMYYLGPFLPPPS